MTNQINFDGGGSFLGATSLVVSVALAYAIETGLVSWSRWWLVATGAPFALAVLSTVAATIVIASSYRQWFLDL